MFSAAKVSTENMVFFCHLRNSSWRLLTHSRTHGLTHLSNALQHAQSKEPVWAQPSGWRGEDGQEGRAEHTQAQEEFPAVVTREVAPRNLRAQVAKEERAEQPTLCFQIPRILRDLRQDGGDEWMLATRNALQQ